MNKTEILMVSLAEDSFKKMQFYHSVGETHSYINSFLAVYSHTEIASICDNGLSEKAISELQQIEKKVSIFFKENAYSGLKKSVNSLDSSVLLNLLEAACISLNESACAEKTARELGVSVCRIKALAQLASELCLSDGALPSIKTEVELRLTMEAIKERENVCSKKRY